MRRVQLVDLDGCIADDRWRRNLIKDMPLDRGPGWPDKFEEYHAASYRDRAVNLGQITPNVDVVIMTGRPLRYRAQTLDWLGRVGVRPLYSLFRPDTDTRPSVVVKGMQLEWLLAWYDLKVGDIVSAIDDQEAIVQMYRREGIASARVVRIGGEEHFHG